MEGVLLQVLAGLGRGLSLTWDTQLCSLSVCSGLLLERVTCGRAAWQPVPDSLPVSSTVAAHRARLLAYLL